MLELEFKLDKVGQLRLWSQPYIAKYNDFLYLYYYSEG